MKPTPVEKLQQKWAERWAPWFVRIGGGLFRCECEDLGRHVAFYIRPELQPGKFTVELWVYRG